MIPTSQNTGNIEYDMKKLVPEILHRSDEEMTRAIEMLVRAYDPCISCSAHTLKIKIKRGFQDSRIPGFK